MTNAPAAGDASEIWHGPPFPAEARQPGPDPERTSYGSFFSARRGPCQRR